MSDTNENDPRLTTLENKPPQKKSGGIGSIALIALIALASGGAVYWFGASSKDDGFALQQLSTSTVESFQTESNTGQLMQLKPPAPEQRIEAATLQIDEALQAGNTTPNVDSSNPALEQELANMREQMTQSNASRDAAIAAAVSKLKTAFEEQNAQLKADADKAKQELEMQKAIGDAERQALQARLDAAVMEREAEAFNQMEAEKLAMKEKKAEQARLDAMELEKKQITSPSLVYGASRSTSQSKEGASGSGGTGYEQSDDEKFLRSSPALVVAEAEQMQDPDRTLAQGSVIQAVLQTAINSDLAGNVVAVVSEPVQSYTGDRILIPRGSRLFGAYRSGLEAHQQRLLVSWSRILTPDGKSMQIAAVGGDRLGRSGLTGFVDTKFGERFGGAALISLIGAAPAVAANNFADKVKSDTVEGVAEDFQDATGGVIADQISIAPTIYIDQGSSVTVLVDRDVVIYE